MVLIINNTENGFCLLQFFSVALVQKLYFQNYLFNLHM